MKTCFKCGSPIQWEDIFCGECGSRQPGALSMTRDSDRGGSSGPGASPIGELIPGTTLQNRYEVVKRVGGGGMGNVYQAYDRNLDYAMRAVKEMIEMYSDANQREKAVEDFRREAKLLASLKHPSIPTIYDHFIEGGRYYLVMEFITGSDLATRQREAGDRFEEATVAIWGIQLCDVLDYLHHRVPPIIYRDLKPANLMIDTDARRVMLIDFGIARVVAPTQRGVTAIGTMGYAPPELFSGQVEPRSDIYSLGATMFHLLTGADPRDRPLLIFDFSRSPRPCEIHPDLAPNMEAILIRAVDYKPENRFGSAREMKRALEEHLTELEKARPEGVQIAKEEAFSKLPSAVPPEADRVRSATPPVVAPVEEKVYCCHCGVTIGSEDVFCAHCGARQPTSLEWPRDSARLLILDRETTQIRGTFFLQKESQLIGRTDAVSGIFPEIDLSSFDPQSKISRRHARIWRSSEEYLLEDLSSANGTWINDAEQLSPKEARTLRDGDTVQMGETRMLFRAGPG